MEYNGNKSLLFWPAEYSNIEYNGKKSLLFWPVEYSNMEYIGNKSLLFWPAEYSNMEYNGKKSLLFWPAEYSNWNILATSSYCFDLLSILTWNIMGRSLYRELTFDKSHVRWHLEISGTRWLCSHTFDFTYGLLNWGFEYWHYTPSPCCMLHCSCCVGRLLSVDKNLPEEGNHLHYFKLQACGWRGGWELKIKGSSV